MFISICIQAGILGRFGMNYGVQCICMLIDTE